MVTYEGLFAFAAIIISVIKITYEITKSQKK